MSEEFLVIVKKPTCEKRACSAPATQHVLVYQHGGYDEGYSCDEHAKLANVCKLGELVMSN